MQSLSIPLRLEQNGLLRRGDPVASIISLLQVMARTPAGSWQGCPVFGLRDLFEGSRQRVDVARLAHERISEVFADLGLSDQFTITDVTRELSPRRETDTYSITVQQGENETFTTAVSYEL